MGVEKNGAIIGGVIFNCFTGGDVAVTVAGERFTRGFISAVGNYVFTQMGCLRMSVTTEQPKVIEIAKRLGAQTEGCKRNHFGKGRDGIVLGILKEDWKF
jgi:RimJ/RimL family protein N-acetyltransferase